MMRICNLVIAALGFAAVPLNAGMPEAALPRSAPIEQVLGTWTNPKRTLAVRTEMCGVQLCGSIVSATPKAQQDAREAGVDRLIGTQLLRDYRFTGKNQWSGTVYIPDMGRSFSSRIVQLSPRVLRISGCILKGLICRSQDWIRL
jgi:uncharacterized protein (DUF2147 family)